MIAKEMEIDMSNTRRTDITGDDTKKQNPCKI